MTWWDDQQQPDGTIKPPTAPLDPNAPPGWFPPEWAGQPIRHTQGGLMGSGLKSGDLTPVPGMTLTPAPGIAVNGKYYPTVESIDQNKPVTLGAPTTTTPGAAGGSSGPPDPNDRNSVKQWIIAEATKLGRSDIAQNPDYWVDQAMAHTKPDGSIDTGYWSDRMKTANQGGAGGAGDSTGFGLGGGAYGGPGGFGGLTAPFTGQFQSPGDFSPPNLNNTTDPGYAARLQMGIDAIQKSAAAKGTLLTGGTLKDLTQFGQDFASNEYDKVFNRALTTNETAYNRKLGEFGLGYNIYRNNQNDAFQKLYGVTGLGLNAANSANNDLGAYGAGLGGAAGQFADLSKYYGGLGSTSLTNQGNINQGIGNTNAAGKLSLGQIYAALGLSLGNTGGNLAGDIQQWWNQHHSASGSGE